MERRWITPHEAAEYLGVHLMTIYSWINKGKIPFARVGRLLRVDLRTLEAKLGSESKEYFSESHKGRRE